MRLKTSKTTPKVAKVIYLGTLLLFFVDLVLMNIEGTWGGVYLLSPLGLIVSLVIYLRGHPSFEYDSDGEVLNFTTSDPNFRLMLGAKARAHVEFPKRKLGGFRIKGNFYKRTLIVQIKSKEGYMKKERFSISFLSQKQLKSLKQSLTKVLQKNKEVYESGE